MKRHKHFYTDQYKNENKKNIIYMKDNNFNKTAHKNYTHHNILKNGTYAEFGGYYEYQTFEPLCVCNLCF